MKKINMIFVLFIIIGKLYSQDVVNPAPLQVILNNSNLFNRNLDSFVLGWNWFTPSKKFDNSLNINFYHGNAFQFTNNSDFIQNANCALQVDGYVVGGRGFDVVFNAQAQLLSPIIDVNTAHPENFAPPAGDNSGAVFGFMNKNK